MRGRVELSTVRGDLFAIVRNLFLQHQRRARRRQPLDEQMVDRRPGPEKLAGDRDQLRLVMGALAGLPEVDRAAVLMRTDAGFAYEKIALALGICVASAR